MLPIVIIWHLSKVQNRFVYDGVSPSFSFTCDTICAEVRDIVMIWLPSLLRRARRLSWMDFISLVGKAKVNCGGCRFIRANHCWNFLN